MNPAIQWITAVVHIGVGMEFVQMGRRRSVWADRAGKLGTPRVAGAILGTVLFGKYEMTQAQWKLNGSYLSEGYECWTLRASRECYLTATRSTPNARQRRVNPLRKEKIR